MSGDAIAAAATRVWGIQDATRSATMMVGKFVLAEGIDSGGSARSASGQVRLGRDGVAAAMREGPDKNARLGLLKLPAVGLIRLMVMRRDAGRRTCYRPRL